MTITAGEIYFVHDTWSCGSLCPGCGGVEGRGVGGAGAASMAETTYSEFLRNESFVNVQIWHSPLLHSPRPPILLRPRDHTLHLLETDPVPPLSFPVRVIVTDAMGQTGRRILTRLANSPRLSVTRMDVVDNNTEANTQMLAGADSLVIVTKFVPRESPQDDRQDGQPGNNTARECPQNGPQLHM